MTDRLKDVLIVGGFDVYPVEVENVLARHPAQRRDVRRDDAGQWRRVDLDEAR